MNARQISRNWIKNFQDCQLVSYGKFQKEIAVKIFHGTDNDNGHDLDDGFRHFHDNIDYTNIDQELNTLIEYLHSIGITISKEKISESVTNGSCTYNQILKKAFYLFKDLTGYDEGLDIKDPYSDNVGDFLFFVKIEEGDNRITKSLVSFDEINLPDLYEKFIELPKGYEEDPTVKKLFDVIEYSGQSFFITGKAGSGKSTFIHHFAKKTNKKVLLLAFTGIAAINVRGQTIHSFFRFPLKPLVPQDSEIKIFDRLHENRKIIENVDIIIIDEVSMLRSDLLEGIDHSLRMNGGEKEKPFGGKQMILVGDIFQLPPVVDNKDIVEMELFQTVYSSEYFFGSKAYGLYDFEIFEFQKSHRQSNKHFVDLLNKVRDCSISESEINEINEKYEPGHTQGQEEFAITIATNNSLAKRENSQRLNELPYKNHVFQATITGEFKEDKYPTEPILKLKRNAQIILVKNDSANNGRRWVNGTMAKVLDIEGDNIEIELKDGSKYTLHKETWENRKYKWDNRKSGITSQVKGTFEQFPIKLAWAITIHKSQGLTFENVILNLGSGAFINGQLYTALSRCRSLEGLTLKRKIKESDIIEDKRLIDYYNNEIKRAKDIDQLKLLYNPDIRDIINWGFLLKNKYFFSNLFSTHHPFNEIELMRYNQSLVFGDQYTDMFLSTGLTTNKYIKWTESLRKLYYHPTETERVDEWRDYEVFKSDFEKYPIQYDDIVEAYISWQVGGALEGCSDAEEMAFWHESILEQNEPLKKLSDRSYEFSNTELLKAITDFNLIISSFEHFYDQLMVHLRNCIEDFEVIDFFERFNTDSID